MSFYKVFDFLRDLQENNHKAWMDEHRDRYEESRDFVIDWANQLVMAIKETDPDFVVAEGRKAISRINNNLMFHPDKPTYKDNFGVELNLSGGPAGFYIHMALSGSFIGGGIHNPDRDQLKKIRQEIDYNGQELEEIVNNVRFKDNFEELNQDDKLKTAPQGYSQEHRHIELLRLNRFAAMTSTTQKEIAADGFGDHVVSLYQVLLPLGRFLNKAVDF